MLAEEYRARPQGFRAWRVERTPRLLGALEYVTSEFSGVPFRTIAPGDADRELGLLTIGRSLESWRQRDWEPARHPNWRHALSAWRVLARFLMSEHPRLLRKFTTRPATKYTDAFLGFHGERLPTDLIATPITWRW